MEKQPVRQPSIAISRNIQGVQGTIISSLVATSVPIKAAVGTVILFYCFSYNQTLYTHLSAVPGYVLPPNFWIWTLITHSFLQAHIVLVLVDIAVIILSGKLLEPIWGYLQMGLFFLVVTSISAIFTALTYVAMYSVTGRTSYLFETYIHGLGAYIGGFCVAVKQLMPDHILFTLPYGKLRNKHIPLMVLLAAITLALTGIVNGPYAIHFSYGIIVSWIYLRFYQRHTNGNRGDLADEFSFASFFPPPFEKPIAILSNSIFTLLVKFKICKKPERRYDVGSPTTITVTLPGTDPADAERRRQIAIKALNERLSRTTQEDASWPGLEDDEEEPPQVIVHSTTDDKSPSVDNSGEDKTVPENPLSI